MKVRLYLEMEIEVSEDYLQKLKKNSELEIFKHVFGNHTRYLINHSLLINHSMNKTEKEKTE